MTITLRLPWKRVKPAVPRQFSRIWDCGKPYMLMQVHDQVRDGHHVITLTYVDEVSVRGTSKAARRAA